MALTVAALAGELPLAGAVVIVAFEAAALFGIALPVFVNQTHRWQERWISYRLLAELCRKQYALCAIGRTLPGADILRLTYDTEAEEASLAPREGWVAWYFMAALRAGDFPQGDMASAKPRALTIGSSLVAEQIAYHESRLARARDAGERIGLLSEVFFWLTLLVALLKFLGALDKFGHVLEWGSLSGALLSAAAGERLYWLRKSLCCSANSHLKTVALSRMSASSQIARRLSPSAMRLQIASPSSVVNNDGRPTGHFRGFMGLDQFDRGAQLAPYYARRLWRKSPSPGRFNALY
jgi:hypothetical protein